MLQRLAGRYAPCYETELTSIIFDVWRITNPDIHLHNLLEMLLRIVDVLANFLY